MSNSSFVNGLITGAGIVLVLMSVVFLMYVAPLENIPGVSTTELKVAIILGGVVAVASVGYEFYTRKQEKTTKLNAEVEELKSKLKASEDKIDDDSKLQSAKDE